MGVRVIACMYVLCVHTSKAMPFYVLYQSRLVEELTLSLHKENTMYKLMMATLLLTFSGMNYAFCNNAIIRTAPDSRYELLNSNTEVKDKKTGLIWQRCSLGQTWNGTACISDALSPYWVNTSFPSQGNNILQTVKNMGNGWRVPNIKELDSLIEQACYSPSINDVIFPNTPSGGYWSSSPAANDGHLVWVVDFTYGSNNTGNKTARAYVRPVRSE